MNFATLAALAMVTGIVKVGPTPAAHPHPIKNGADAIMTAWETWKTHFPESGAKKEKWRKEYRARFYAGMWMVEGRDGLRTIVIDPKDGHIMSAETAILAPPDSASPTPPTASR